MRSPSRNEERYSRGAILGYFISEALRHLWVSRRTHAIATAMITISLLILGSFLLLTENLSRSIEIWRSGAKLNVYLRETRAPGAQQILEKQLRSLPGVQRVTFVSREAALERFKSYFANVGPVVDGLGESPFPASLEAEVSRRSIDKAAFDASISAMRRHPAVEDVQFDWEWVERVERIVRLLNTAGIVIAFVLALVAALMIANAIRLTMVLYQGEMQIMRLVGATEATIRAPFFIEGILQGLCGGLLALTILYLSFRGVRELVDPSNAVLLQSFTRHFLPWEKSLALVLAGGLAGAFGSWISVRGGKSEEAEWTA